jgi:hypothetical protein
MAPSHAKAVWTKQTAFHSSSSLVNSQVIEGEAASGKWQPLADPLSQFPLGNQLAFASRLAITAANQN